MKNTKIISAFPAVGKSWLYNNQSQLGLSILDSDSSNFSWIEKGVRHPDFPNNYIQHIKENIGKVDIICVSSHDVVRKALQDNNIHYILVYPNINDKEEYLQRFKNRGNDEKFIEFIEFISNNSNKFINDMDNETFPELIKLKSGEYLESIIK